MIQGEIPKERVMIGREVIAKLQKRPISRITARKMGLIRDPDIKAFHLKMNFSFENGYHPELTRKLVPDCLVEGVIDGLDRWCRPMTSEEIQHVEKLDLSKLVISGK